MTRDLLSPAGLRRLTAEVIGAGPQGTDVAMGEDEAERLAGPAPTVESEDDALATLAATVLGSPAMVLCPAGLSVPTGVTCTTCRTFNICPADRRASPQEAHRG